MDNFGGSCSDKSQNGCLNSSFQPGFCPGNKDVQYCTPNGPRAAFVAYVRKAYKLAKSYGYGKDPNLLVMEWLRKENPSYNDIERRELIGDVDGGWIFYAKGKGLKWEVSTYPDAKFDI